MCLKNDRIRQFAFEQNVLNKVSEEKIKVSGLQKKN